jgi:cytidylate kinase
MHKIIIAIDGCSSSGKSTLAKALAQQIGYIYIDTGAMYRAVALYCLQEGLFRDDTPDVDRLQEAIGDLHISFRPNPQTGRTDTWLNDRNVEQEIRTMHVSNKVSPISALSFVRQALVAQQQAMGKEKGIVMDGRDIGTVVFPEAELKIFLTASPEVRTERRLQELIAKGETVTREEVRQNLLTRDHLDSTRPDSPLRQAPDALLLDNSTMTIAEQTAWALDRYRETIRRQHFIDITCLP